MSKERKQLILSLVNRGQEQNQTGAAQSKGEGSQAEGEIKYLKEYIKRRESGYFDIIAIHEGQTPPEGFLELLPLYDQPEVVPNPRAIKFVYSGDGVVRFQLLPTALEKSCPGIEIVELAAISLERLDFGKGTDLGDLEQYLEISTKEYNRIISGEYAELAARMRSNTQRILEAQSKTQETGKGEEQPSQE